MVAFGLENGISNYIVFNRIHAGKKVLMSFTYIMNDACEP